MIQYDGLTQFQIWVFSTNIGTWRVLCSRHKISPFKFLAYTEGYTVGAKQNKRQIINEI